MRIFKKLGSKNYWISTIVIIIAIMLFKTMVSDFITKYISMPELLLSFLSFLIIIIITRILTEEVLEI